MCRFCPFLNYNRFEQSWEKKMSDLVVSHFHKNVQCFVVYTGQYFQDFTYEKFKWA